MSKQRIAAIVLGALLLASATAFAGYKLGRRAGYVASLGAREELRQHFEDDQHATVELTRSTQDSLGKCIGTLQLLETGEKLSELEQEGVLNRDDVKYILAQKIDRLREPVKAVNVK